MNVDEIPSFTERGINDSVFALIEKNFNARNYSQTIEIISMYETNFPPEKTDLINIYKGITYTELGRYDEATSLLSEESVFSESLYNQMSQWFLALNYLKAEKIAEAKQILKEIAKNKQHYKFEEARAILKKLD
jgi:tetratricopeptide (TPR) repeat protein